jgi:hypothetical protein
LWKGAVGWKMHSLWAGSKRGGFTFFPELAEGADGSGLGEQKKQLFGNPLYTVKEMITNGDLFIADIHFDAVYEEEFDRSDDDEGKSEYSYYVQFSTPELAPCDRDCETSAGQYDRVEELLKNGQHEGKILWGRKKKSNYYYAFAPKNGDITAMLGKRLLENFICYGESTEKRKLAPKGGAGNTTYDKVFDAIWDNTIGKL